MLLVISVLTTFLLTAFCEEGSIADLFLSEDDLETDYRSQQYAEVKQSLLAAWQAKTGLEKVWDQLVRKLEKRLEAVKEQSSAGVPVVHFRDIVNNGGKFPANVALKVSKKGVVIVRGVLDRKTAVSVEAELVKYLMDNEAFLAKEEDTVYEIYWSKAQMRARTHPNMVKLMQALLSLWRLENATDMNLSKPLMYVDRFRRRSPMSRFPLPPHIDGGAAERWTDPEYRAVYRRIFNGSLDEYDPWLADHRHTANMNTLGHANGATFFRGFQGWLSLSSSGPGSGTLKVIPNLQEVTQYLMLRPLLNDVPEDILPGVVPGKTFHLSSKWHSALTDSLVPIPSVSPGDTVWWHPDLVHSVEEWNSSAELNSVLYIPAGPDCPANRNYLRRLRHSLIAKQSPPDFPSSDKEKDFIGRAMLADLSPVGLEMMGWPADNRERDEMDQCQAPRV